MPFLPWPSTTLLSAVPSTIPMDEVQVDVTNNIITWQPPAEPNRIIRYYNIRISQNETGGERLVRVVQGITGTRYDFSVLGLSAGTYMIQVGSLVFIS